MLLATLSAVTLVAVAPPAGAQDLPEQKLPVYGGSGGTAFSRDCGAGRVLTGLRYREGLYVDALGLLCRPVSASGALGSQTTVGTLAGGGGGTSGTASCYAGYVVAGAEIWFGAWVDRVRLRCRRWDGGTRRFKSNDGQFTNIIGSPNTVARMTPTNCEDTSQPASGIRGRAHSLIDALGFVCDEP
jgi:hypothetical protein